MAAPAITLFDAVCQCGIRPVQAGGLCRVCYYRRWHDFKHFGGSREVVLERDRKTCQVCRSRTNLVHHRERCEDPNKMICLCRTCHARVHRIRWPYRRLETSLFLILWREQHPGRPEQMQLDLVA